MSGAARRRPVELARTFVEAIRTRPASTGRRNPPLVVLHGALGAASTYGSLLRRPDFAPEVPKIAADLRGHGRTPWDKGDSQAESDDPERPNVGASKALTRKLVEHRRLTYPAMADDVVRMLTSYEPGQQETRANILAHEGGGRKQGDAPAPARQYDICGHSLGGKVGMAIALREPSLVRRLIVVDIAPVDYSTATLGVPYVATKAMASIDGLDDSTDSALSNGTSLLRSGTLPTRKHVDSALAERGVDDPMVRAFVCTNLVPGVEKHTWRWRCDVEAILDAFERPGRTGIAGFDVGLDSPEHVGRAFTGPVLFIAGGKSNYVDQQRDEALMKRFFPNFKLVTLPDCGHWLQSEDPDAFCREANLFLDAH